MKTETTAPITRAVLAAALSALALGAHAQGRDLTIVSWGGAYQDGQKEVFFKPFNAGGTKLLDESWDGGLGVLRTKIKGGNNNWDVVQVEADELEVGCDEGLYEKLDVARIGGAARYLPGTVHACGVGAIIYNLVLAYDGDKTKTTPSGWADFFDSKKFPGKRAIRNGAKWNLEVALIADGVPSKDVYKVLRTPEGTRLKVRAGQGNRSIEVVVEGAGAAGRLRLRLRGLEPAVLNRRLVEAGVEVDALVTDQAGNFVRDLKQRAYWGVSVATSMGSDNVDLMPMRNEVIPGAARFLSAGRGITMPEPGRITVPHWITTEAEGRKAVEDLAASVRALAGEADLQVRGGRSGFPEALFEAVSRLPGVAWVNPGLELEAGLAGTQRSLRVIGLDALRLGRPELIAPDKVLLSPMAHAALANSAAKNASRDKSRNASPAAIRAPFAPDGAASHRPTRRPTSLRRLARRGCRRMGRAAL